jgi:hypothetical protein
VIGASEIKPTMCALAALSTALTWTALTGCHSDHSESVDLCQPHEGLTPICGFQSPENLALLPDKSGLLVSEFGQMGDEDGRLSMLSVSDGECTVLYESDMPSDSTAPLTDRFEVVFDCRTRDLQRALSEALYDTDFTHSP